MKYLIITTDKNTLAWKSLPSKLKAIKAALDKTKNATWEVEIIYRDLTPKVVNGRVDNEWFDGISHPLFKQGNHFVAIHFGLTQRDKFGIKPTLRGSNINDSDWVGEMYFWSDEHTERKGLSQFIQTSLHEASHELARTTHVLDKTHDYHAKNPDISGIFSTYDMSKWQPTYIASQKATVSWLQSILSLLKPKPVTLFNFPISQAYGVKNAAWYPKTKHHIGTDFAVPEGTPIVAPFDCEVISSAVSVQLGNYCGVKVGNKYYYCMHLQHKATLGTRKKGQIIGFTGNTGFSTNPHLHVEGWHGLRDISKINETNFRQLTFEVK